MRSLAVIRTCCVVGLLALGGALAAQSKPSLIGATRAQVLARFGEPKSNIVAGDREVLFFATERVVLRHDRVVEVEDIEAAPAPKPVPAAPATTEELQAKAAARNPALAAALATGNLPDAVVAATQPATRAADAAAAATAAGTSDVAPASPLPAAPAAPPEPQVIIKSIRPPSAVAHDSAAAAPPPTMPVPVVSVAQSGAVTNAGPVVASPPPPPPAAGQTDAAAAMPGNAAGASGNATAGTSAAPAASVVATQPTTSAADASAKVSDETKAAPAVAVRPTPASAAASDVPAPSLFTAREYAIAGVLIAGGLGYIVWRRRNRRLMLAATAVSQPFSTAPLAPSGGRFTADLLNTLEAGTFEQLVAAYYNKTGVVATRAHGSSSPVHVRISWKGEPRPFAYVHCIARPAALVGAEPVEALCQVLAAEDIRRGYIVTAGKFSVTARDLAEEKHVTLLSGDIFLEKLNALPDPARAELMRGVTQADATIAMCPKCDIKMMRSPTDATAWQCAQCGTTLPRG